MEKQRELKDLTLAELGFEVYQRIRMAQRINAEIQAIEEEMQKRTPSGTTKVVNNKKK